MSEPDESSLHAWEQRVEWPMAALAVVFLAAYSVQVLWEGLGPGARLALAVVNVAIWALFAAEFVVRIVLAPAHSRYALRHAVDLVTLLLPFLRTLRVLRVLFLLRALNRLFVNSFRGRFLVYGMSTAALFIYCGALAELDAERGHSGANITTFGDSLWWAAVTIFTVGYGDLFPVTGVGRLVGVLLMAGGVALVGAVTASFATWLIDRIRVQNEVDEAATRRDLHAVHAQLSRVEGELAEVSELLRANQSVERPASASS